LDSKTKIYLDYAASTPVDERVLQSMLPFFSEVYGNPNSLHSFGQQAEAAVEQSREIVARTLHCRPEEIIFTGCGSESDNLAIRGAALAQMKRKGARRIVISSVEHPAVSHTARQLAEEFGFEVNYLPVDDFGQVDPAEVEAYLRSDTAILSVVYANNEIGTINPISAIGEICRKNGVWFHTDAVQGAAHLPMNVQKDMVDFLSIGAHKFYGPKGVGALYARRGQKILPIITGGKQEMGLRAGTQNVAFIVGLAEALRLTQDELVERVAHVSGLRDMLISGILDSVPKSRLTGHPTMRLPNHASFVFKGVDANTMLMLLDMEGFACSSGSACKAGIPQPSDILLAIGLPSSWASGSLRITLGRFTTQEHIENLLKAIPGIIAKSSKA
jgi:cysteine desulfurase